jgi:hypothetical protein
MVTDLLQEENRCLVHAIDVCEVYYDLYRRDGEEIANGIKEVLEGYGFEVVEEVPSTLWKTAGKLKAVWGNAPLHRYNASMYRCDASLYQYKA